MAAGSALELQLGLYVLKKRVLNIQNGLAEPMSAHDAAKFAEATRKKTFPKLITAVRRCFRLSDGMLEALKIAKDARDHLAHGFWQVNIGFIQSESGIELIVQQCSLDAWHFKETALNLEREIGFTVDDFAEQSRKSAHSSHNEFADLLSPYL